MSDFLIRLAQRQRGQIATVEPRVPDLYAPVAAAMPLAISEDIPAKVQDLRRMTRPPPLLTDPWSAQDANASISKIQKGAPTPVVNPAQPMTAKPGEERFRPPAKQNDGAVVAPPVDPRVPPRFQPELAVVSKTNMSLPLQSKHEQRDSFSPKSETAGSQVLFARESEPELMPAAVLTAPTAPPRIEPKLTKDREMTAFARDHADSEPPVHVTIGRIEVTAVTQTAPTKRVATPRKPAMSLDDYLARRQRGER